MEYTRRDVLKAAGAAGVAGLAGCSGSGNNGDGSAGDVGSQGSGPVYDAADEFESLLESEAEDTEYLSPKAAEGGFVEVEETGENAYKVTVGSTEFTDEQLCGGGEPSTQDVVRSFEWLNGPWIGTFGHKMYEDLGPVNTAYQEEGEDAVETYAFRFEGGGATVTYEASGEELAELAFDETTLDKAMFEDAFFQGMDVSCR